MNYYFVDYENVQKDGLKGIEKLTRQDIVYIFYSEKAENITFELHEKLNESQGRIEFQKVNVGTRDALDFQLASWMGYLIGVHSQHEETAGYFLVTRDGGYRCLCDYWKKHRVEVNIIKNLNAPLPQPEETEAFGEQRAEALAQAQPAEDSAPEEAGAPEQKKPKKSSGKKKPAGKNAQRGKNERELQVKKIREALPKEVISPGSSREQLAAEVQDILQKAQTKVELNNALVKKYGNEKDKKASRIYKAVKPLFKDMKCRQ